MKLEKLEALRGLAAIYVVFHHALLHDADMAGSAIAVVFKFGQEAVILFFLLSGFVINYSFRSGADRTLRSYFLKRAARIYIPLVIVMGFGWIFECFRAGQMIGPDIKGLVLNLLMLQDTSGLKPHVIVEPYMNNTPLWSLSYEWWFYMLYFPLQKYVPSDRSRDAVVACTAVLAAAVYFAYPGFVPRVLMYMSIWWLGVALSNAYLRDGEVHLRRLAFPVGCVAVICVINALAVQRSIADGSYVSVGVHPSLELRHHLFALVAVLAAVAWRRAGWLMFDRLVAPFQALAPVSYVVYISHYYFVVESRFLAFLGNWAVELAGYVALMLAFSYLVEMKLYPVLQKRLLKLAMAPAARPAGEIRLR